MSIADDIRKRLNDSVDFSELLQAVRAVVDLWPHPDERESSDDVMQWDEGYNEAMDEVMDVIAQSLGLDIA